MFKHKDPSAVSPGEEKTDAVLPAPTKPEEKKDVSPEAMRELAEKNLKWSQIIYEQNRRINTKLLWLDIAQWVRITFYIVLIVLAIRYIPPLIQNFSKKYDNLTGGTAETQNSPAFSSEICDFLALDPAKCEQIKTLVK